jgi:ketosteroid isomerase-like protein
VSLVNFTGGLATGPPASAHSVAPTDLGGSQESLSSPPSIGGYNADQQRLADHERATEATRIEDSPASREQVARQLFDAFNRRDLQSALALVHAEIVFEPVSAAVMADGAAYRGRPGIERYLADVKAYWQELTVNPVQIRAAGRAVVALGQTSGRGSAGVLDRVASSWVLKFKDGQVVHAQVFSDERAMREALGAVEG